MGSILYSNLRAAFLVDNGFCEREYKQAYQILTSLGVNCRIVSPSQDVIKAWNEEKDKTKSNWGQDYASDRLLSDAIPSDYDIIVIPGGSRSVEKLNVSQGLKSFIMGFVQSNKPIIVYNKGIEILSHADLLHGYSVATKDKTCEDVKYYGGRCASTDFVVSKNLITLARYVDVGDKLQRAVCCVLNGEQYFDKIVGSDNNMPNSYKAA